MWNYTKCTAKDRIEKLNRLTEVFHEESDCLDYLSEVAEQVGYVNQSKFAAVFKKQFDLSPLEYRRSNKLNEL